MVHQESSQQRHDWQQQHYAAAGEAYGTKHFTQAESAYTAWILEQIASVQPRAQAIAEVGAGTCVFASLLGKKLSVTSPVVCYEPVQALLEGAKQFDNVEAHCGDALDFATGAPDEMFDLIFTKDTAHHFANTALTDIHEGICRKLNSGGRYLMVVRTPPDHEVVPVGRIASARWHDLYTPLDKLLAAMQGVRGWQAVQQTRWQQSVETPTQDWLDGVRNQDTWSVFSALSPAEIDATLDELESRFAGVATCDFVHQYDVAVFEKA